MTWLPARYNLDAMIAEVEAAQSSLSPTSRPLVCLSQAEGTSFLRV